MHSYRFPCSDGRGLVRHDFRGAATATLALCLAFVPGAFAAEGSGATWHVTGHEIFDIAGSYSSPAIAAENGVVLDALEFTLALDPKGRISGSGSAQIAFPGLDPASVSFTLSGSIASVRGAYGTARVTLALKKFTAAAPYGRCGGALSASVIVSGPGTVMGGLIKGTVTVKDATGQTLLLKILSSVLDPHPDVLPPPSNAWTVGVSLVHAQTKRTGSAMIALASARTLDFSMSGKYIASSDTTSLSLKGTGVARGVSLTASSTGGSLSLKGKVLGQTISVVNLTPRITISATLRDDATQLCDGSAECGDAILYGIPLELAVDSPTGVLAGGTLSIAAPQGTRVLPLDGALCDAWEWRSCSLDAGSLRLESEQLIEGSDSAWELVYTALDHVGVGAVVRLLVDNPDFVSPRSGLSITVQQTDALVDAGGGAYGIPYFMAVRDDNRALLGGSITVKGPEQKTVIPIDAGFCTQGDFAACSVDAGTLFLSDVYDVHAVPRGAITFTVMNALGKKAAATLRYPSSLELPDLVVWPVVPAATEVARGQELAFSYTMRNTGVASRAKVSTFDVATYLSPDATLDPTDLRIDGGYAVWQDRIVAGWSRTVNDRAPIAWDIPDGQYYVIVLVDAAPGLAPNFYPGILESNERNNWRSSDTRVRVQGAVDRPDLVLASVVPDTSEVRRGEELTFTYLAANIGAEGPAGDSLFDAAVYLSLDAVLDPSDIELAEGYRAWSAHLERGWEQRANDEALIGDDIPDGDYRLIVVIDAKPGQPPNFFPGVTEADEQNNYRASALPVRVVPPPPSPKGTYYVSFGAELFWTLTLSESTGGWDALFVSSKGDAMAGAGALSGVKLGLVMREPTGSVTLTFAKNWETFSGSFQVVMGSETLKGFLSGSKTAPATLDLGPEAAPPKFVAADVVPRDTVASVSRFRSSEGRDVSDDFESCRHMGHFFNFCSSVDAKTVPIASPVDGAIVGSTQDPRGTKICIRSTQQPAICFILSDILPIFSPAAGTKVRQGQVLGVPYTALSDVSVLVWIMTPAGNRLVSYFDVMTDTQFVGYECCGITGRSALIISKAERNAFPLTCSGDAFLGVDPLPTIAPLGCCRRPIETLLLPGNVPLQMVYCPAGTFMMGRKPGELESLPDESPQHQVTLTTGFWLARTEVTKLQWYAVMGTAPWSGKPNVLNDPDSPAVYVNWHLIQTFINKVNAMGGGGVHLPTEAQWEYACRAGTTARYYWGDDLDQARIGACAWYYNNAGNAGQPYGHVVGSKVANAWGLYDMSGNVLEWCSDWYGTYSAGSVVDPQGPAMGTARLLRGGSWFEDDNFCRSAARNGAAPGETFSDVGFRLAR